MAEGGEVRSPTEGTQPDEKKSEEANGNESKGAKGPAASQAEKNGLQLMQQAEAKVKSASGWFGKLTGYGLHSWYSPCSRVTMHVPSH